MPSLCRLFAVSACALPLFVACPEPPPTNACTSAIDCDLGLSCRDGVCTGDELPGEGEGEGEGEEDEIIAAACAKFTSCGVVDGVTCVNDVNTSLAQLRAASAQCAAAADTLLLAYECITALNCDEIQSSDFTRCPILFEAEQQLNACQGVGEGEGEGEGEPVDCNGQFAFGPPQTDNPFLFALEGRFDGVTSAQCPNISMTIFISFDGDASVVSEGFFSFDGSNVTTIFDIVDTGGVLQATVCTDDFFSDGAVQLVSDGSFTNSVCGFFLEGEGEGEGP